MSPSCEYCGTELDEDGCVESDIPAVNGPSLHTASQCREYVHATLRTYQREIAELREREVGFLSLLGECRARSDAWRTLVVDGAMALDDAARGAPMSCARTAASVAMRELEAAPYLEEK